MEIWIVSTCGVLWVVVLGTFTDEYLFEPQLLEPCTCRWSRSPALPGALGVRVCGIPCEAGVAVASG